jgi:hypothetical protein
MRLLLALLFPLLTMGQFVATVPAVSSPTGTSVTVNFGLPGASLDDVPENGIPLVVEFTTSFTTPAAMTSPSWGSVGMYWISPDAAHPNWGVGLYGDASASGTVTTSGATVTWSSGNTFLNTQWGTAGLAFNLCPTANTCATYLISSVTDSTHLTLTTTPTTGCSSACTYQVTAPGNKICTSFSSTVATAGWNTVSLSGCGTPAASTRYWLANITQSSTQGVYTYGQPCEFQNGIPTSGYFQTLGSFTSNSSWPANGSAAAIQAAGVFYSCTSEYIPITYTTNNRYTIVTSASVSCDVNGATCRNFIPATPSNASVITVGGAQGNTPFTGVVDLISGTTTDTLTKRGSCPTTNSGLSQICVYSIDRATSGVNQVNCTDSWTSGSNKLACWVLVVVGTQSTSFDTSCYDSSNLTVTSGAFTGCTTSTTAAANELVIGVAINRNTGSCCGYSGNYLEQTGSWSNLYTGFFINNPSAPFSIFQQVLTSTGTPGVTGSIVGAVGSPEVTTATTTFR